MNNNIFSKRYKYIILFLTFLALEVFIALFVKDNIIRPYIGDVLVVFVVYYFVKIFFPKARKSLILYVLIFCIFIEFLQYLEILKLLNLNNNRFLSIVLGSTFDIKDIFCYFVGCCLLYIIKSCKKVRS